VLRCTAVSFFGGFNVQLVQMLAFFQVDILFCRFNLQCVPDRSNFKDDRLLLKLDANSLRSFNGLRIADEIIHCVPSLDRFRLALKTIKLWATSKANRCLNCSL